LTSPNEVRIDATLHEDIAAVVTRIEQRMESLERTVGELGREGGKAGAEFAAGMDKAAESADEVGDQSRQAKKPVKDLGDEAIKAGGKAAVGAKGLDTFSRNARKASRNAGGFRSIITAYKFAGVVVGLLALAGGLSAVGAGAGIAIGGLAPLSGVVAGALPLYAAARLSMLAWTLAAEHLAPVLTRIKNQFTELGTAIAHGGLESGLDFFADHLGGLAEVSKRGLASLGGQIGDAARETGRLVSSGPFLEQIDRIFHGMEPIVGNLADGVIFLARAIINVIEGALPMAQSMAAWFASMTKRFQQWTAEQLASGRMTAWLNKSWQLFLATMRVIGNFLVGLFNIFKIGAGYSREMGMSLAENSAQFRAWTESAEGQARINQYFQDSLPALREMGRLLGFIVGGFGSLAANQDIAPLLAQINNELVPALADATAGLASSGGLGPALISVATEFVRLWAATDFSALTMLAQAIAGVISGLNWMIQNVPGVRELVIAITYGMIAWKVGAVILGVLGTAAKAYKWVLVALTVETTKLTLAQRIFAATMTFVGNVFKVVGGAIVAVIRAIGVAILANPLLVVAALIVGALVFMWFKFAWFRDFVITVWNAIKDAAVAVAGFFVGIWNTVVSQAVAIWNTLVAIWQGTVNTIVSIAMWIWDHGLKQVFAVIVGAAKVTWSILTFIVQTGVYIIMAVIALIAVIFEAVWKVIVAVAKAVWEGFLQPIFNAIGTAWTLITGAMQSAWQATVNLFTTVWNAFYNGFLAPVFNAIGTAWNLVTGVMRSAWQSTVGGLTVAWNGFKSVVSTVVGFIRTVWSGLTSWLGKVFAPVGRAVGAVFEGIGAAAETVGGIIKGIWDAIVGAVKAVWNTIARVWNAIPSVTVPDWVPLVGGKTFGLPKMPMLWHGGEAPGGKALVGEHGPEPVVVNGQVTGMVGLNGPEVATLPTGGYVVPNLSTLSALPGLAKTIPTSVAAAVARSVPGYADTLGSPVPARDSGLASSIDRLARSIDGQVPPVYVQGSGDITKDVLEAWRTFEREKEASGRYRYETTGR
jgi:phage-related protein